MKQSVRERGFSIVELLVVLAIIGLLAAIAIPMYMNSINRAKQSRTMSDLKAVGMAWELRAADRKAYNAAGATFVMPPNQVAPYDIASILEPTYIRAMPRVDGWGHPLEFATDVPFRGTAAVQTYAIRSPGRNGQFDGSSYTPGATDAFDTDIVYTNGGFVTYASGAQH